MRARSKRPENWQTVSRRVKRRDNYRCNNCNYTGSEGDGEMHAHHIVPLKDGGSNNMTNLITLCEDCHDAIHHKNKIAPTATRSSKSKREFNEVEMYTAWSLIIIVLVFWPFYLFIRDIWFCLFIAAVLALISLPIQKWHLKNNREKIKSRYEEYHAGR